MPQTCPAPLRRRALAALTAAVFVASPGAAQTVEQAARDNFALATSLCFDVMIQRRSPDAAFNGAGFTYNGIDRGTNDYGVALGLDHYFEAPGDTAKAEVDRPSGAAGICQVMSVQFPQDVAAQIVDFVLAQRGVSAQRRGPTEWSVSTGSLPLIVTVSTIERHRYEPAGTVSVSMSYPG